MGFGPRLLFQQLTGSVGLVVWFLVFLGWSIFWGHVAAVA
jgi:hypothetical protein